MYVRRSNRDPDPDSPPTDLAGWYGSQLWAWRGGLLVHEGTNPQFTTPPPGDAAEAAAEAISAALNAAADEAIKAAFDAAHESWRHRAKRAVRYCAHAYDDFTADEIWAALDSCDYERPTEPRALGGVLRSASAEGLIEPTGEYRCGDRRHGAPLRVWRRVLI